MARFTERTERLIGADGVKTLEGKAVAIFGLGGVGSFAAEALARAGVGRFLLVDADTVEETNLNRQLIALRSTLGIPKVEVMANRIAEINPDAAVEARRVFYLPQNADTFDFRTVDYIVDAVDTVAAKVELAVRAENEGIRIISCMGAGNKLDPTAFQVADIFKTEIDPLCRVMRKALKARGISHLPVVYSREPPAISRTASIPGEGRPPPGSISFVPSVAGLIMAGVVVRDFLKTVPTPCS